MPSLFGFALLIPHFWSCQLYWFARGLRVGVWLQHSRRRGRELSQ
jgi:hypothetical protein